MNDTNKNTDNPPVLASDKGKAASSPDMVSQVDSDGNTTSLQSYTSNTTDAHNSIETKLLWRMLQVPGFTKAMIADIRGEWVTLYSHMNGVPMRLYRKVADVATWLGYEVINGHLNACDTQEFDPVVIDEPAIDPDDTEIMPCPDVAEWEDLRGLNVTPWVSAGETDFTEPQDVLPLLNNLHWLGKNDGLDVVGFDVKRNLKGTFILTGKFTAEKLNRFWQDWHGGIKEPLAEKQRLEEEVVRLTRLYQREESAHEIIVDMLEEEITDAHNFLDQQWVNRSTEDEARLSVAQRIGMLHASMAATIDTERERNETLMLENAALRQQLAQDASEAPTGVEINTQDKSPAAPQIASQSDLGTKAA